MYKTTVKYEDFDGNNKEKDLYFNLTKAEITELQLSEVGGFDKKIQSIIDSQDNGKLVGLFKELILKAYGERTPEGGFIKSAEISSAFATTEAYSELFMTLLSDENMQKAFFFGIMPKDLSALASKQLETKAD